MSWFLSAKVILLFESTKQILFFNIVLTYKKWLAIFSDN